MEKREFIRDNHQELRDLYWKLLAAQEADRKRIASELHDSVGQSLNGLRFILENLVEDLGKIPDFDLSPLTKALSITHETIHELRRIAMALRPSLLDDLGIAATLSWHCRQFQETYTAIQIESHIEINEYPIPHSLETVIYRIVQEALNNVAKHAKADHIGIRLKSSVEQGVQLAIQDNGQGFDLAELLARNNLRQGLGLVGMRERAELSGGTFALESKRGKGTLVQASWALQA